MNRKSENDPDQLGGIGDLLSADALERLKEVLKLSREAGANSHGSKIELVYVASGGQHVETQINIGATSPPNPLSKGRGGTKAEKEDKAQEPFDNNTPLSALFRESSHEELKARVKSWRPHLAEHGLAENDLALTSFQFDFTKIRPVNIYMDLAHLINHDALCVPMSVLAVYMFRHSNLSKSEKALYVQLKRYRCMCK